MIDLSRWRDDPAPRKPSVIVIGAQKAGTTWLSAALSQHPRLWSPPIKEIHFFDQLFCPENRDWIPWHFREARRRIEADYGGQPLPPQLASYLDAITGEGMSTPRWYRQVFSPAPVGTRPVDITPAYAGLPDDGVRYVAENLPRAQFIYILRHPVDRFVSQLKMNLSRAGRHPQTVEEWIGELDAPELYARGDYLRQVPRWQTRFGPDRLLILPFGLIARDPRGFLGRIETFLGLAPHDYAGIAHKIFAAPAGLVVPDPVRAEIRHRLDPQFTFLADHFDAAFNAALR